MMNELGDQETAKEKRERLLETVKRRLAESARRQSARTGDEKNKVIRREKSLSGDHGHTGVQNGFPWESKLHGDAAEQEGDGHHEDIGRTSRRPRNRNHEDSVWDNPDDWSEGGYDDADNISIDDLRTAQVKTQDRVPTPRARTREPLADVQSARDRPQRPWDTVEPSGDGDGGKREMNNFGGIPEHLDRVRLRERRNHEHHALRDHGVTGADGDTASAEMALHTVKTEREHLTTRLQGLHKELAAQETVHREKFERIQRRLWRARTREAREAARDQHPHEATLTDHKFERQPRQHHRHHSNGSSNSNRPQV
jgi:hypothetical protein